jgi:hypothetical protein
VVNAANPARPVVMSLAFHLTFIELPPGYPEALSFGGVGEDTENARDDSRSGGDACSRESARHRNSKPFALNGLMANQAATETGPRSTAGLRSQRWKERGRTIDRAESGRTEVLAS